MANVLVDDLDNTVHNPNAGVEVLTWNFAFGPDDNMKTYCIDLTTGNYAALEKALQPFIAVASEKKRSAPQATRTKAKTSAKPQGATKQGTPMLEVRQWLRDQGVEGVSDRGALKKEWKAKWDKNHAGDPLH